MKSALLMFFGAVIFAITFAAWWYLNALACGMNTTGCRGVTLAWGDWEALQFFVPTFIIGAAMFLFGVWKIVRRNRR